MKFKVLGVLVATAAIVASPVHANANLLINGDFEGSTSPTETPPGWTNIGHTEGVFPYSYVNTPAYNGLYFYDIGGFGDPTPNQGDGITQAVATNIGALYKLTFGYSSENISGDTTLRVSIGALDFDYTLLIDGSGAAQKPFTTEDILYFATGASTAISFTVLGPSLGNNDPFIDNVIFTAVEGTVPEPVSLAVLAPALLGLAWIRRRHAGHA